MHAITGSPGLAVATHSTSATVERRLGGEVGNYAARSLSAVDVPPTFSVLPDLAILSIANYLPFKELSVLARTCKHYHAVISDSSLFAQKWFARFSIQQQQQLRNNVKGKSDKEINTWVSQFTTDRRTTEELVKKCNASRFPERLLFKVSSLMAQCPAFDIQEMASIPHNRQIKCAFFSPDSKHALFGSYDDTAKIFSRNPDGCWTQAAISIHGYDVESSEFSPDSQCLVMASLEHTARLFVRNAGGHWQHRQDILHSGSVYRTTFSANSRSLITADFQSIKVHGSGADGDWVEEAIIAQSIINPEGHMLDFSELNPIFGPYGRRFVARGKHIVGVYARQDDESWQQETAINSPNLLTELLYATFSPDGNELITISWNDIRQVHFYARNLMGSWIERYVVSYDPSVITTRNILLHFEVSQNSKCIMMTNCHYNYTVAGAVVIHGRCHDGSWRQECDIRHGGPICTASFNSDSNHVVTVGLDKTAKIHRRNSAGCWQEVAVIVHDHWVLSATFSLDGNFVMTHSFHSHTVKIHGRTAEDGWVEKAAFSHPCEKLSSAAFSPDGSHILTFATEKPGKTIIWSIQALR